MRWGDELAAIGMGALSGAASGFLIGGPIGAIVGGVGGAVLGGVQGESQQRMQRMNLGRQESAQRIATNAMGQQLRANILAQQKANKQPDIGGLLGDARAAAGFGISSTLLTGPSGVTPGTVKLGQPSLLGS